MVHVIFSCLDILHIKVLHLPKPYSSADTKQNTSVDPRQPGGVNNYSITLAMAREWLVLL